MSHRIIEATGPPPFVTRRIYQHADGSRHIWSSRHHRKSLVIPERVAAPIARRLLIRCLWLPRELNWWIGTIFALGALLFGVASVLSLWPALAGSLSLGTTSVNVIFFAGSIPFTTAAYLQLLQAANAGPEHAPPRQHNARWEKIRWIGWRPHNLGWLSCLLQWMGTILFNFNTYDALLGGLTWLQQDLLIWVPNLVGSMLFLASGYLAFIEAGHRYWSWRVRELSWWVVFVNLWGCCGFMIAAVYSIILPGGTPESFATLSLAWTLQGAVCFFAGSVLMLPETALEESTNGTCERRTSNDRRGSCTGFECDCAQVGLEPGRGGWQ